MKNYFTHYCYFIYLLFLSSYCSCIGTAKGIGPASCVIYWTWLNEPCKLIQNSLVQQINATSTYRLTFNDVTKVQAIRVNEVLDESEYVSFYIQQKGDEFDHFKTSCDVQVSKELICNKLSLHKFIF